MLDHTNILPCILILPLIGCLIILFLPSSRHKMLRLTASITSLVTFIFSLFLWIWFDYNTSSFQFIYSTNWLNFVNLDYTIGIDGISLFFVLLTTLLVPLCLLVSWGSVYIYLKEYLILFLLLESILLHVFCVLDLLLFYIFFESVLIPIFIIIGVWGSRTRKIRAAYQFFLYTLVGSLFILLSILLIYFQIGTTNIFILTNTDFNEYRQLIIWLAFFASFAVKIPIVPFHIWLPEAHAEAPTAGSVILAGILLKLGGYGFLRFSLPIFPYASTYFSPFIFTISVIAIVYASLTTLRQVDMKKLIAYSSVAHIGYVTIGIFTLNVQGLEGSILLMLGHGLVSSALFLCVGVLYDRHKTRVLKYYSGMAQAIPLFSIFFLFFTIANIGFPGTSNFVGELLVLAGIFQLNSTITFLASSGIVFSAAYSLWIYNRVSFGLWKTHYIEFLQDVSKREFFILTSLIILIIWIGIYPIAFLGPLHTSVMHLIEHYARLY
nr:NADH dehydrogenase subunit 4 [Cavernulicola chilensis]